MENKFTARPMQLTLQCFDFVGGFHFFYNDVCLNYDNETFQRSYCRPYRSVKSKRVLSTTIHEGLEQCIYSSLRLNKVGRALCVGRVIKSNFHKLIAVRGKSRNNIGRVCGQITLNCDNILG